MFGLNISVGAGDPVLDPIVDPAHEAASYLSIRYSG